MAAKREKKRSTGQSIDSFGRPPQLVAPRAEPKPESTIPHGEPSPSPSPSAPARKQRAAKSKTQEEDYQQRARRALDEASSDTKRRGRPKSDPSELVVKFNTTLRASVIRRLNDRIREFNEPQLVEVPASYFVEAAIELMLATSDVELTKILKSVQDSRYSKKPT